MRNFIGMNRRSVISILLFFKILLIVMIVNHQLSPKPGAETLLETIHGRSSVRAYTPQQVSAQQVENLLRAAMAAPSSRNIQPWEFYVVSDPEILNALSQSLPYAAMAAGAPLAIVICGDTQKGQPNQEQQMNWVMDCSAASQNLLLAAHAMGLGAVWTGIYPYRERIETVRGALDIPPHLVPLNLIPVGYPLDPPAPKDKWDEKKVHYIGGP